VGELVLGINLDTFPRGLPSDAIVHDTFRLRNVPEAMRPALNDLLGELALAEAPISGRKSACILVGSDEGYGGHVVERDFGDVTDAFSMAYEKVESGTPIYGIMVTGEGSNRRRNAQ
jgi:hypothetical protein